MGRYVASSQNQEGFANKLVVEIPGRQIDARRESGCADEDSQNSLLEGALNDVALVIR